MKIAVTSNNGKDIDTHFGKAERILVYEITEDCSRLLEIRNIEKYCDPDPNHKFNKDKFEAIYEIISDCEKLYTQQIGEVPAGKLIDKGIIPGTLTGDISLIPDLKNKKML